MLDMESLFTQQGLRPTKARLTILQIISQSEAAMSHAQVLDQLAGQKEIDRVTVYRVLDWLTEHGLVHRISGENRAWKFQFNRPPLDEDLETSGIRYSTAHQHAHLHCVECGRVTCIHELEPHFPSALLEKYNVSAIDVNLKGVCLACSQKLNPQN